MEGFPAMHVRTHTLLPLMFSLDFIKAAGGFGGALVSWGMGTMAQAVDQSPSWMKTLDTPLIVVFGAYGMTHLWKALSTERAARIADRDAFETRLRADAEKGEQSRRELLMATNVQTGALNTQTVEIRNLVRELRIKGLHDKKAGEDDEG